ncbi:MAG TPA: hypothetical protein VG892_05020 [Terriglobales bacterium]|nr:hypothetical protein [Terriglobales bacterium]
MRRSKLFMSMFCLVTLIAFAQAQTPTGVQTHKSDGGQTVLADAKGMTLYISDRDTEGKSTCNGACATNWPPLAAAADAKPTGQWTVVTRDDGAKQWAYKGKPVYTFAKDSKAGQTSGDGAGNNNWHSATP